MERVLFITPDSEANPEKTQRIGTETEVRRPRPVDVLTPKYPLVLMLWRWREVDGLARYKKPSWPPILVASLFAEPFAVILSSWTRRCCQGYISTGGGAPDIFFLWFPGGLCRLLPCLSVKGCFNKSASKPLTCPSTGTACIAFQRSAPVVSFARCFPCQYISYSLAEIAWSHSQGNKRQCAKTCAEKIVGRQLL